MLSPNDLEKMNSIIESMKNSINGEVKQERTPPQDIFDELFIQEESPISVKDIIERDSFSSKEISGGANYYFGIDASTTKTIETVSGVTFCISNAKTGIMNRSSSPSRFEIENHGTITIGILDINNVIDKEEMVKKVRNLSDDYTDVYAVFVEEDDSLDNSNSRVKDISRTKAESKQLSKTVDSVEKSSIVYLDGSIYPRSLVRAVMSSDKSLDSNLTEANILNEYIQAIKNSSSPVVGVVKNPRSQELLRSYSYLKGSNSQELKWKDDYTIMIDYLRDSEKYDNCFYTSEWFCQNNRVVGNKKQEISWIEDNDFKRNFFYCHLVSEYATLRFETLSGFISDLDSDKKLMEDCVADVIMSDGVPEAIRIADDKANISYKNSKQIGKNAKDSLSSIVKRYNRDERDYTGDY